MEFEDVDTKENSENKQEINIKTEFNLSQQNVI